MDLSKDYAVMITGASRGIGREIAVQVLQTVGSNSTVILIARNEQELLKLKTLNEKVCRIEVIKADLSADSSEYIDAVKEKLQSLENNIQNFLIFHNAGNLGEIERRSDELTSAEQWHTYLQTNLISTILLNNWFYAESQKVTKYWYEEFQRNAALTVVDITSLLAVKAFPSFTQYSVGKAAREAFFRSFACEHPNTKVLSYSPGPVDTSMRGEITERSYSAKIRHVFGKDSNNDESVNRVTLTPKETVACLLRILCDQSVASGSRIDYFDVNQTV